MNSYAIILCEKMTHKVATSRYLNIHVYGNDTSCFKDEFLYIFPCPQKRMKPY